MKQFLVEIRAYLQTCLILENVSLKFLQLSKFSRLTMLRQALTMLVVDAKLSPTQQQVSLRIQRPRLVVAFDFLLAVGEFFVPSMHAMLAEKGDENPLDMKNGMFLNDHVYKQTVKEIRISPKKPLVADYEGVQEYIYNGQGNTLRLLNRNDEDLSMFSPEAIIFVGDGKRLIFRNVVIQVFSRRFCHTRVL